MLKAHGLRYVRAGQEILANVDLSVEPGESLAVTGPSGSGKTSLLAILSGLTAPTAGQVSIDGKPLTKFAGPELGVSVVLQGYGLVSLLTAVENIEIALGAAGRPAAQAALAARAVLARLGLEAHADQLIEELSGGQQQRTAVARALALEPRLLIADEPTAELDPAARAVALAAMFDVAAGGGALVLATHDPEVASRCDAILDLRADHRRSRHGGPATVPGPDQPETGQSVPGRAVSAQALPEQAVPAAATPDQAVPDPAADLAGHQRGEMLRDYLEGLRRRGYAALEQAGQDRPWGPLGPGGRELVMLPAGDLAGFADLGLRLLELHQRMNLAAVPGEPEVPRCLSCMWRWPCPTFLTLAELLDPETRAGQR
ncbi:MAG TPA: ATP-binding cassette domain-containing protein [Streptosporangiaceae bacterium]|jgi:ABC-type lipoprotein export system ATPase subunit